MVDYTLSGQSSQNGPEEQSFLFSGSLSYEPSLALG